MTSPYLRRRDPQPVGSGWEVAAAVIGGALLGVGLAALCGLGVASALFGRGWVWPHGTDTIDHVLGGLFTGHPGQGLDLRQARLVAGPTAVYLCVAVCEMAAIVASIVGGVLGARYWRPGDARRGIATRREAEQVLGVSRLRAVKEVIRPDLYAATPRHSHSRRSRTGLSTRRIRFHRTKRSASGWRDRTSALTPKHQRNKGGGPQ